MLLFLQTDDEQQFHLLDDICTLANRSIFFPFTILIIVSGSYLNWWDEYLLEHDPRAFPTMACMSKGILFVVMRYAEMYPSSKINDHQTEFFYSICGKSDLHSLFDVYRLQPIHIHKV